jgi:hypothetical protein
MIDSMIARLRTKSFSERCIRRFFLFLRKRVMRWRPCSKRSSVKGAEMEPRSPMSLPRRRFAISGTGARSSTLPGVRRQASNSPWSLTARWSFKPKNQPIELLRCDFLPLITTSSAAYLWKSATSPLYKHFTSPTLSSASCPRKYGISQTWERSAFLTTSSAPFLRK